jgi:phosphoglucosamine mutase
MSEILFGTDGYRGPANDSTETGINPTTFKRLAYEYVGLTNQRSNQQMIVIVGSDTRTSSPALREAVCGGAKTAGAEVWDMGIAPTPVIAWAAQNHYTNAIAITASHNPGEDNGFKPFDIGGVKPSGETLREIERRYFSATGLTYLPVALEQRRSGKPHLKSEYISHVVESIGGNDVLRGKKVIIDGANGAVYDLAPRVYQALGAEVITFSCNKNGAHINQNCGAAHLDGLKEFIKENPEIVKSPDYIGAFASDGDGDRVIGVDHLGRVIDGNYWMNRLSIGQLGIVGTIYTNTALQQAVTGRGIEFHECANGDHYVTTRLMELTARHGSGFTRGGEFTGHLIDLDHLSSGDGIYMGAWLAADLAAKDMSLADVYEELSLWPENMVNVRVSRAAERLATPAFQEFLSAEREQLGELGRIIVRPSGTEPLVRIWAESKIHDVKAITSRLAQVLQTV